MQTLRQEEYLEEQTNELGQDELLGRLASDLAIRDGKSEGDIRLFLEIMAAAVKKGDLDYILSDKFKWHCYLVGVDQELILEMVTRKRLVIQRRKSQFNSFNASVTRQDIIYKNEVEGLSAAVLAEEYSVCPKTIRKLLDPLYEPVVAFGGHHADIIRDYEDGMPLHLILHMYNISETTLYRAIKDVPKRNKKLDK